jgi:hypothetical protein
MARSETINTGYWQSLGWELTTFNAPGLVIEVAPPDSYRDTQEWPPSEGPEYHPVNDEAREDAEDLQDAAETELRYRSQGVEGFIRYRE